MPNTRPPTPEGYQGQIELMALEMGVDLEVSVAKDIVSLGAVERMMRHCAACSDHKSCTAFLVAQHGQIEAPPSFCVDRKLILFLHDLMPKPVVVHMPEAEEAEAEADSADMPLVEAADAGLPDADDADADAPAAPDSEGHQVDRIVPEAAPSTAPAPRLHLSF
ncbi:DUF6455 family protein [Rhodobacter ferrooxidans]|uniref:DUF6455 domain-containing protein n=1 Tax=Rhodobacter ferrooxidans TaxID=371731 RepID=C8RZZ5_9RHOB|nr:DUF6455 family protein [Rhodobacter sp. SW2]EEW25604.1 hypothetical protein Rsw2DRAFT_1373 [Rhodobacter sp. SW2]